ncbi:hypothetical protein [Rhodobacter sp. NSM]
MKSRGGTVHGIHAPAPRPTFIGALWVALAFTLPVSAVVGLAEFGLWLFG